MDLENGNNQNIEGFGDVGPEKISWMELRTNKEILQMVDVKRSLL